ncbi:MAG: Na+/H+ antiporter NhaA [Gammaproteobacteria bacterium]|nr:Na+/H+ antiporter NhaA [Gammaproteobacteria bacterium]
MSIQIGTLVIAKPMISWINEGLMVFFFLIGLEIKGEVYEGQLSSLRQVALPAFAALGGMAVPAAIYLAFNDNDPIAAKGWAIPAATDIVLALAFLALLGPRVPTSLKVFLTALAIFNDFGIALHETKTISNSQRNWRYGKGVVKIRVEVSVKNSLLKLSAHKYD